MTDEASQDPATLESRRRSMEGTVTFAAPVPGGTVLLHVADKYGRQHRFTVPEADGYKVGDRAILSVKKARDQS